jgi:hypothetical protein
VKARRIPVNFGFQSRPGRYGPDGSCRVVNAITEEAGTEAKEQLQVYAMDGLRPRVTLPDGPVRCMLAIPTGWIVLSGKTVYRVLKNFSFSAIGQVPTASFPSVMRRNLREDAPQIAIASGDRGYIVTMTPEFDVTSLKLIDDPDLPTITWLEFIDGYFIYAAKSRGAGRFLISDLNNGSSISAASFATAVYDPDPLVAPIRRKGELWLFGASSVEVWANNGTLPVPFGRLPGVAIDRGCIAPATICVIDENAIWVADDLTVRMASGYKPERISHHDVERKILKEPVKTNLRAFEVSVAGHSLYVLSGNTFTYIYDLTTQLWHERDSYRKPRWRAEAAARCDGVTLVGDYQSGNLYEVDPTYTMDGYDPIVMLMRGPIQHDYPNTLQWFDICLDVVGGVGVLDGIESNENPEAMLRYSDDGGLSWSNERRAVIGRQGDNGKFVRFSRLGQSGEQGRVVEFRITASVAKAFLGANAKVRKVAQR